MKRLLMLITIPLLFPIVLALAWILFVDINDFGDPLLNAACEGDVEAIATMVEDGKDPNRSDAFGNTPLSIAASFDRLEAAEYLLEHGARLTDKTTGTGMTPLHCAVYHEHDHMVALLISYGADVNEPDKYGWTALNFAAGSGNAKICGQLLEAGADIEWQSKRGWRPLHHALRSTSVDESNRLATVALLLECGADPNALNSGGYENDYKGDSAMGYRKTLPNEGNTPLAIARSNGFSKIARVLIEHGAK